MTELEKDEGPAVLKHWRTTQERIDMSNTYLNVTM